MGGGGGGGGGGSVSLSLTEVKGSILSGDLRLFTLLRHYVV